MFIYWTDHSNGNWFYAYHSLLEGPFDLEA